MNNSINSNYKIQLEILSPLSIGSGEENWKRGIDYIVKDDKLYKLNYKRIIENNLLSPQQLSSYLSSYKTDSIQSAINNHIEAVSDLILEYPHGCDDYNGIKPFIRNNFSGNPIVPGSSIKGAIRSILFGSVIKKDDSIRRNKAKEMENEVFGTINKDIMRFLKVSDIDFQHTKLINTKIFNLHSIIGNGYSGGWKHGNNKTERTFRQNGFNSIYEVLGIGEKGIGTLMLPKGQITQKYVDLSDINNLFEIINAHTYNYIEKEIHFFEKYHGDNYEKIINFLIDIGNDTIDDNSFCIFRMSAGSGFNSITGDWQQDSFDIDYIKPGRITRGFYNNTQSSKSRKIAISGNKFMPMGFVKMSIMNNNVE